MLRLHVRKKGILEVQLLVVGRTARTFALAVVLVDVESYFYLLMAGVEVGLRVFVKFGAGVK